MVHGDRVVPVYVVYSDLHVNLFVRIEPVWRENDSLAA